ncbi:MAG: phytoene desaturase family protein, partial [Acidobacteriota bacterium]
LPQMIALQSQLSVFAHTARYIKNPRLRQVFSFHPLLVGGNPFTTTSIYSLIHALERKWGVHFAMGGTGEVVAGLVRLMEEVGIELDLGRTVDEITVENEQVRGIRLADGTTMPADLVVANADAPFVYKKMIAPEHRPSWTDRRIERQRYSMGLFVIYFGTTRRYPQLAHHEILLGPRYKGLIKDVFEGDHLPEDFSLYLHAPTRTDPSMAPDGCESMYALVPVPNLRANIDWSSAGPELRDRVLAYIENAVCPGLVSHVVEDFYVTPEHFQNRLLSLHGAGFSIQPTLTQSAYFRFHNRSEDIGNLFFVGAGTQPGAGMPGVLSSAKVMERLLPEAPARRDRVTVTAPKLVQDNQIDEFRDAAAAASVMTRYGTTFSWAASLLDKGLHRDLSILYAFCRYVDNLVDERPDDPEVPEILAQIRHDLERGQSAIPPVALFLDLARQHQLPIVCALDLVNGVASDLGEVRFAETNKLIRYCYRVASTVGVMICGVLGVDEPEALPFAADLGIAMQLTNIARDIQEDFDNGRIYLPASIIDPALVTRVLTDRADPHEHEALQAAVVELLDLAERYYRSADKGMRFLPRRARWAILTASRSYEAIGDLIRQHGTGYWRQRVYTSRLRKVRAILGTGWGMFFDRGDRHAPRRVEHERGLHNALSGLLSVSQLGY